MSNKYLNIEEAGITRTISMDNKSKKRIEIRVRPDISSVTYGPDTVLCDCFKLENAAGVNGGITKLVNLTICNEKITATEKDFKFLFSKNQQNMRTDQVYNGTNKGDLSTAQIQAMDIVGMTEVDMSENSMDLGDNGMIFTGGFNVNHSMAEVTMQTAEDSQDLWCNITAGLATTVLAAGEWELVFVFEYKD